MYQDASIIFQIAGIGIIVAMIHTILKQMGKDEYAQFITLVGFIIVLMMVIDRIADHSSKLEQSFI